MGKRDVDNLLKSNFLDLGFKKKGDYFVKEIDKNIFSSIHYGVGYRIEGHTIVYPNIGIGYLNINKMYANLCDIKFRHCPILVKGVYEGWLPENNNKAWEDYKRWIFIDDSTGYLSNNEVLSEMMSSVFKHGEPFWKEMSDFDNLFNAVYDKKLPIEEYTTECLLPILYYLKGEKENGTKYIEEVIKNAEKKGLPTIHDFNGHSIYNRTAYLEFAKRYEQLP